MKLEPNTKLVMIGDSITDAGRNRDAGGEGLGDEAYGGGYVRIVRAWLQVGYPEHRIRVVNKGLGGNTARDLAGRWQKDVFDLKPDWVSMMIGINDVWRQFDMPLVPEAHVPLDEYRATVTKLVESTVPRVKGMVLMTPYYIEPNPQDAMRARMDQYGAVIRELAETHGTVFVDTQAAFHAHLEHFHPNALAWDRVHPNSIGHTILARAWLNAVDYTWA